MDTLSSVRKSDIITEFFIGDQCLMVAIFFDNTVNANNLCMLHTHAKTDLRQCPVRGNVQPATLARFGFESSRMLEERIEVSLHTEGAW
jgi:hypothetical protein